MKKLLFLLPLFFVGCLVQDPVVKSPRYFNKDVDLLGYTSTPYETTWKVRAQPGEGIRLVFKYEIVNIDFKPDPDNPGEFIFEVKSEVHGQ